MSQSVSLTEAARYARLALPLVMWARSLLEKEMLEDSRRLIADRGSRVPADLINRQAQLYGKEVRRLFFETRQLSRQMTAVEERFQAELRQAMTAHDEEREWIALEVHDRIAQTLASVFHQLQAIEGLTRSYPELRQAAVRASVLCREVIREARNIMNDLRPPILDELGLVPAMEEELSRLAEETSCQVRQALNFGERPPRTVELALYRVFREALVNTRRHARATVVEVSLKGDGDGVRLEISDNGVGFDVQEALEQKRIGGLLSMRRRAELGGGTCQIDSQPGKGTKVSVWLPLPPTSRGSLPRGGRP